MKFSIFNFQFSINFSIFKFLNPNKQGFFKNAHIFVSSFVFLFGLFLGNFVFAQDEKIVVATTSGQIIFYNLDSQILSSFYLPNKLSGSANIVSGDVDGDFENEIVVVGKEAGFSVGIFNESGFLKYPIFNVFNEKESLGGQKLALGDLDNDGKDEIIVTAARGVPYVKIFNYKGKLKNKFLAFSKNYREGINLIVGDIDRDRKDEIVFSANGTPLKFFIYKSKKISSLNINGFDKEKFSSNIAFGAGDLEGDGKDELGVCNFLAQGQCQISIFGKEGKKNILWPNNLISQDEIYFKLKDADYDGRAEAIVSEAFGGRISIYKFNDENASIWKNIYTLQNISDADIFSSSKKVKAKVIYVDDGDTIFLDNGEEIRYIGMDTPEIGEPFYLEATNKNKELIYGREVTLEFDKQKIDPHGRYLAYVYSDGIFINLELAKAGLAKTEFFYPDVKYAKKLLVAEKEAKKKKVGRWK